MSPKCLPYEQRKQVITDNILTHNYEQLAILCHCTKKTITRTVKQWRNEGGYEEALWEEFQRFYPDIKKEFPDKAFDRLCFLLGKTLTRKVEAHTIEEVKVMEKHVSIVGTLRDYEEAINQAASRDFQANRARKQVDTHNADT